MGLAEAILSGGLSGALGGLTGLAGVVVQKVSEHKKAKVELEAARERYSHEIALREADAKIMAQEWAARTQVAKTEAEGKEAVAESAALEAALKAEPQRYSESAKLTPAQMWLMVVLDVVRGLTRPGLTIYLCVIATAMYARAIMFLAAQGAAVDPASVMKMIQDVANTILYLWSTAVLFWFGGGSSRNKK